MHCRLQWHRGAMMTLRHPPIPPAQRTKNQASTRRNCLSLALWTLFPIRNTSAQPGFVSKEGAAALEEARRFIEIVDSGDHETALNIVYSSLGTNVGIFYRMLRMRRARGTLSNMRLIDFRPNGNSQDGFPFNLKFESDATNNVIFEGSIRKTTVIQVTVGRQNGIISVQLFSIQY